MIGATPLSVVSAQVYLTFMNSSGNSGANIVSDVQEESSATAVRTFVRGRPFVSFRPMRAATVDE
jgi:hypothetical protein